jgi:hypothetical protein
MHLVILSYLLAAEASIRDGTCLWRKAAGAAWLILIEENASANFREGFCAGIGAIHSSVSGLKTLEAQLTWLTLVICHMVNFNLYSTA